MRRDAYGNMVEAVNAMGKSQKFEYYLLGRLTKSTDPLGRITSYQYDRLGQVKAVTDPRRNITGYEYGPFGLTSARDAEGQVTSYQRDPLVDVFRPALVAAIAVYLASGIHELGESLIIVVPRLSHRPREHQCAATTPAFGGRTRRLYSCARGYHQDEEGAQEHRPHGWRRA